MLKLLSQVGTQHKHLVLRISVDGNPASEGSRKGTVSLFLY